MATGLMPSLGQPRSKQHSLAETDTHVPGDQGWVGLSEALHTAWSIFRMSDSADK